VKPHFRAILREIDKIHRIGAGAADARVYSGNGGKLKFSASSALPLMASGTRAKSKLLVPHD
jgi:hypothetical protein